MFPSKTLLSFILITWSAVDASPLTRRTGAATIEITRTIVGGGEFATIPERDLARVEALKQSGHLGKRSPAIGITNANVHYAAQVGIGEPATEYTLLIDTGSSNTFVGAGKAYVQTGSSYNTSNTVSVKYGSGGFSGIEWLDIVALSPELTILNQSIGVADKSHGFEGVDGILGVGPVDLTEGTVSNTKEVPTVMDNLLSQGAIVEEVLGVYFVPSSASDTTGSLTFGGYDDSVITSTVEYVPITTTSPASTYWGIDQSIQYGSDVVLPHTAGIVDTGSTLILLATEAFDTYTKLTGGVLDSATGLLKVTPAQFDKLQPLRFIIGEKEWTLTPNAQIWPRSLNTQIGGQADAIYLVVSDLKTKQGAGLDFINGYTFLERFYSVHDVTNERVGFATTAYTDSKTN